MSTNPKRSVNESFRAMASGVGALSPHLLTTEFRRGPAGGLDRRARRTTVGDGLRNRIRCNTSGWPVHGYCCGLSDFGSRRFPHADWRPNRSGCGNRGGGCRGNLGGLASPRGSYWRGGGFFFWGRAPLCGGGNYFSTREEL